MTVEYNKQTQDFLQAPKLTPLEHQVEMQVHPGFIQHLEIFCYGGDIRCIGQDNIPIPIEDAGNVARDAVVIIRKITFIDNRHRRQLVKDTNRILAQYDTPSLRQLQQQLETGVWERKVQQQYEVPLKSIIDSPYGLFIQNLNILLCMENNYQGIYHPSSELGCFSKGVTFNKEEIIGNTETYYIVDNDNLYCKKYINRSSEVEQVPVIKNHLKANGLYIVKQFKDLPTRIIHLPISEATVENNLYIFNTAQEALSMGDPKSINTEKLLQAQQALVDKQNELKTNTLRLEEMKQKNELLEEQLREEKMQREETREKMKERMEENQYYRKSYADDKKTTNSILSETAKTIAVTSAIVLSVVSLVAKFK